MNKEYKYFGLLFQQRPEAVKTIQFVAAAEDIKDWGGVPSKSATYMKGFQRALIDSHKNEITEYFEIDAKNISPTSVVVAFKPKAVKIEHIPGAEDLVPKGSAAIPVLLTITAPDENSAQIPDLAREAVKCLRGSFKDIGNDDAESEDDDDSEESGTEEEGNSGEVPETEEDNGLSLGTSHLKKFIKNLENSEWVKNRSEEDESKFRSFLIDVLKPATIVDGQHRSTGAAFLEQGIPFSVVGLIDAEWKEEVFQFVVINQRARPIQSEFLSAIISSSLSNSDINSLRDRLDQAGVDLLSTNIMDLVHANPMSPFAQMIDFKIKDASGKLKYGGMLTLAKRFRKLATHEKNTKYKVFFKQVFLDQCAGATYNEKRSTWNDGDWFKYFCAFWSAVKNHFVAKEYSELWEPGTNLLKIVTLQELQNLFLEWLFMRREMLTSAEHFNALSNAFIKNLLGKFFKENWKLTSLQSDTGRKYLREALTNALNTPDYKNSDALFTGIVTKKGSK
jgi:hypothetical protein